MAEFMLTEAMVLTLKGAPISVLSLLALIRRPVDAGYIQRFTGYSDKSVDKALRLLADMMLITRNGRYVWQIARGVKALPLMAELEEPGEELPAEPEVCAPTSSQEIEDPPSPQSSPTPGRGSESGTRKNSESEFPTPYSSSSTLTTITKLDLTTTTTTADSEKFRVMEVTRECVRAGIWKKRAEAIAGLPHVSGRIVRYWTQWASSRHKDLPLAIWRIEHNTPVPEDWIDPGGTEAGIIEETADAGQEELLPAEASRSWETALITLEKQFKRVEYETWIKSLTLSAYGDAGYVLRTGNKSGADWLKEHALQALEVELGAPVQVVW